MNYMFQKYQNVRKELLNNQKLEFLKTEKGDDLRMKKKV